MEERLNTFILREMKKYNLEKVMVTKIAMGRSRLITREKMDNYCNGKEEKKLSVNDDLETMFENIRFGKEPDDYVRTYFLPKLTEHELELVDREDERFMKTFDWKMDADVDKSEMAASGSDSKYVNGFGYRKTVTIKNSLYIQKFTTKNSLSKIHHKSIEEQIDEQNNEQNDSDSSDFIDSSDSSNLSTDMDMTILENHSTDIHTNFLDQIDEQDDDQNDSESSDFIDSSDSRNLSTDIDMTILENHSTDIDTNFLDQIDEQDDDQNDSDSTDSSNCCHSNQKSFCCCLLQ